MLHQRSRFVVEGRVPQMGMADLAGLHAALADAADRLSAEDSHVTCTRTLYVPSVGRWIAVFDAASPESVRRAAKIAQVQTTDVHPAIEMFADGSGAPYQADAIVPFDER